MRSCCSTEPPCNRSLKQTIIRKLKPAHNNLIVALLVAILGIGSCGVYRYERELQRQQDARCAEAHSDLLAAGVYGRSTQGIKEACGNETLSAAEQAELNRRKTEVESSIRETDCDQAFQQYGFDSEVTKQHCVGTVVGKKMGF
jgi:hypothetical protein